MCTITVLTKEDYSIDAVRTFLELRDVDSDAYGMFWTWKNSNGEWLFDSYKNSGPSYNFCNHQILKQDCEFFVLHHRDATQGDPALNKNNHPFFVGTVIGVHQGIVSNYKQYKNVYYTKGDTDSELAISCLNSYKKESNARKLLALKEIGTTGLVVFCDLNETPKLYGVRVNTRKPDVIWEIEESFSTYRGDTGYVRY